MDAEDVDETLDRFINYIQKETTAVSGVYIYRY